MRTPLKTLMVTTSAAAAENAAKALRGPDRDIGVEPIGTAAQLREAVRRRHWDAVLTDGTVPELATPELFRILHDHDSDTPLIECHTFTQPESDGRVDMLVKPQDLHLLGDLLERPHHSTIDGGTDADLRDLVDNASDMIQSIGPDGYFHYVNRTWQKALGYNLQEARRLTIFDIIAPDQRAHCARLFQQLMAGESLRIETAFVARDGHRIEVQGEANCRMQDDRPIATRGIFREVAAQNLALRFQTESRERLQQVLDALPAAAFASDPDGSITYFNRAATMLWGCSPQLNDLRDLHSGALRLLDRKGNPLTPEQSSSAICLKENRSVHRADMIVERPDGERRMVESHANPLRDRSGGLIGAIEVLVDRTSEERALAELRKSEEHFRAFAAAAPDAMILMDGNGRVTSWNAAAERIFGYAEAEIIGVNLHERLVPPACREAADKGLAHFLSTGEGPVLGKTLELVALRKDGSEVPIELSVAAAKLEGAWHGVGIVRDVTERKLADRQLHLFRQLLDQSADAVFVVDANTSRLQDVNEQACQSFGYSREELLKRCVLDLQTSMRDQAAWQAHVRDLRAKGHLLQEVEARRKDGTRFPVEVNIRLVTIADKEFIIAGARDITERKRAAESQARLVTAIEQATDTVMITDHEGIIQYVNPAFERTSGYSRAEVIGQNPRMLKSGRQDAAFYKNLWNTIRRGEVWRGHLVNKRKGGTCYEEDATITPVLDATGEIVNYVAAKRDVTREVQLEEQFRQAQKMEAIGHLAAGVAHDFNNILSVIQGYADLLQNAEPGDPMTKEGLQEILQAASRAATLTRQLLMFSRKQVAQMTPMDLNEVVRNNTKMIRRILRETVELQVTPAPGPLPVEADAGMLDQVLLNLVVNARDAVKGEGRVVVSTALETLSEDEAAAIPGAKPGRHVSLRVKDDGCGMSPATMARLFEPFFTTKEPGQGTGLGLATVFGIVKQHRGCIAVTSRPGEGSTFRVLLPAQEIAAEMTTGPAPESRPSGGDEHILLVEDDDGVRMISRMVLEHAGYHVHEADDGRHAMEAWEQHHGSIRLLLTDSVMPGGISGPALAERLIRKSPGLAVILSSGYSAEPPGKTLTSRENFAFLPKPADSAVLLATVRRVLDAPTGH